MLVKKVMLLKYVRDLVCREDYTHFAGRSFTGMLFEFMETFNASSAACEMNGLKTGRKNYCEHVLDLARGLYASGIRENQGVISIVEEDIYEHGPLILALMILKAFSYNIRPEVSMSTILEEKNRDSRTAHSDFLIVSESVFLEKKQELEKAFPKIIILNQEGIKNQQDYSGDKGSEFLTPEMLVERGKNIKLPLINYSLSDTAVVTSTSGSTAVAGENKGVMLSTRALISALCQVIYSSALNGYTIKPGLKFLARSPYSIVAMLFITYFMPLAIGMTVVYDSKVTSCNLEDKLAEHGIGSCFISGPEWERIECVLRQGKRCDLSSLKYICFGGAGTSPKVLSGLNEVLKECGSKVQVMPGYGSSEVVATVSSMKKVYRIRDRGLQVVSSGSVYRGCTVSIRDVNGNLLREPLERGFICLKSISMMDGYFGRPEETADAFNQQKEYFTGDIGFLDEKGSLFVLGRAKENIVNGKNETVYFFDIANEIYGKYSKGIMKVHILKKGDGLVLCMIPESSIPENSDLGNEICRYAAEMFNVPVEGFCFMDYFPISRARKLDKDRMLENMVPLKV